MNDQRLIQEQYNTCLITVHEGGVFSYTTKTVAQSLCISLSSPPLWIRCLAGGTPNIGEEVIELAQDMKAWEDAVQ